TIVMTASPKLLALPHCEQAVTFVLSRKDVVFFVARYSLHQKGWDQHERPLGIKWTFWRGEFTEDRDARRAMETLTRGLAQYLDEKIKDATKLLSKSVN